MKQICGIDEAGRGALVGPLVIAGICIPEDEEKILCDLGVKDSKLLAHPAREKIFNEFVRRHLPFFYCRVEPRRIDTMSINRIEIQESITIIKNLSPDRVFLDVPARGRGIERYCKYITSALDNPPEVIGGNKFDVSYPIVAAASIIAKVMRERMVQQLRQKFGDFGSGYPNKRTIALVQKNYARLKPIIRMKWKTMQFLKHES